MPKAILTGAAGGIGQATARLLWQKGFSLVLTDTSEAALQKVFPTPPQGSTLEPLDVTQLEAWEALAAAHGDADVLIQLAGIMRAGRFIEQPVQEWDLQLNVNLRGLGYGARTFGRLFAQRQRGHIINIASLAGVAPVPGIAGYTATKFGVRGLSLALDLELRPLGVPVTVICPGPVATPLIFDELPKPESVYTLVAGDLLKPEDVARAVWRALRRQPREITLPRNKALAARIASAFPNILAPTARLLEKGATARRAKYLQKLPSK